MNCKSSTPLSPFPAKKREIPKPRHKQFIRKNSFHYFGYNSDSSKILHRRGQADAY